MSTRGFPRRIALPDTGWAGHIDLCQVITNDVDAGKDYAAFPQNRADLGTDPAIALAEFEALADSANNQVASSGVTNIARISDNVASSGWPNLVARALNGATVFTFNSLY